MKSNHGISLIELVIVMIIMILLITFTAFSGMDSIGKAEATELYEEMYNMKNAINGVIVQKELLSGDDTWLSNYYDESLNNGWYVIYGMDDSGYETSNVRNKLNMDDIKRSYIVSFQSGEVMLSRSVEVLGSSVRSFESVRALVESGKI